MTAQLSLSNSGPHVRKASHFAVYNNKAGVPSLASYPAGFPGQYTVAPSSSARGRATSASAPVGASAGDTAYDITVTGPNRFLRRFTGDTAAAGAKLSVTAEFSEDGASEPRLLLQLVNDSAGTVTFTVTTNAYGKDRPARYRVGAHRAAGHSADPLRTAGGWYDLTVTASSDASWTQRFVGHLENGQPSITGV